MVPHFVWHLSSDQILGVNGGWTTQFFGCFFGHHKNYPLQVFQFFSEFWKTPKVLNSKNSFGLEKKFFPCISLTRQKTGEISMIESILDPSCLWWRRNGSLSRRFEWALVDYFDCMIMIFALKLRYSDVGNANHIFRMAVLNDKDSILFKNTSLPMSISQLHQHSMIYSDRSVPGNSAGDLFGMVKWPFQWRIVTSN